MLQMWQKRFWTSWRGIYMQFQPKSEETWEILWFLLPYLSWTHHRSIFECVQWLWYDICILCVFQSSIRTTITERPKATCTRSTANHNPMPGYFPFIFEGSCQGLLKFDSLPFHIRCIFCIQRTGGRSGRLNIDMLVSGTLQAEDFCAQVLYAANQPQDAIPHCNEQTKVYLSL